MPDRLQIATRIVLPASLTALAVWILIGCIPLPGDHRMVGGGPRPETKIGGPDETNKPLQVGRSTREDVIAVLGTPEYGGRTGRIVAYHYQIRSGVIFYPLCFYAQQLTRPRFLVLRYDEQDRLDSFEVRKSLRPLQDQLGRELRPSHEIEAMNQRSPAATDAR